VAEASDRRIARSYLVEKAISARAWRKILAGSIDYRKAWRVIRRLALGRIRPAPAAPGNVELIAQMRQLLQRGISMQFIYAEPTTVLEWFRMTIEPHLPELRRQGRIEFALVKQADHTFTRIRHQTQVIERVSEWLSPCT
jgi:hypothetical protein